MDKVGGEVRDKACCSDLCCFYGPPYTTLGPLCCPDIHKNGSQIWVSPEGSLAIGRLD
jgi:hypothetical protein